MTSMNYQQLLRNLRLKHGLSQRQMAQVLRVHHGTVALWETGKRSIPGPVTVIIDNFSLYLKNFHNNSIRGVKS